MSHTTTQVGDHLPGDVERLVEPSQQSPAARFFNDVVRSREASILLVLVAVIVAATLANPSFLFSSNGWRDLLLTPSILLLLAAGQAVVIITRNVDLSVGSVLALTAYLTGRLFIDNPGIPILVVVIAGVATGAGLGLVNGLLVSLGRVPALVITLGTLYIYRGVMLTWAGSDRVNASDMPSDFLRLGTQQVLGIPVLFLVSVVVVIVVGYYLHAHRGGRGCTPSAPIRTPPCSTASRSVAGCSRLSSSAARSPGSPGCCTPPATARSAPVPGWASSSRRSPRW